MTAGASKIGREWGLGEIDANEQNRRCGSQPHRGTRCQTPLLGQGVDEMEGAGLVLVVITVVGACIAGALWLLFGAAKKAGEALPDAVEHAATIAGRAAGKAELIRDRAASAFRNARNSEKR